MKSERDILNERLASVCGWTPPGHPATEAARRKRDQTAPFYDDWWRDPHMGDLHGHPPRICGDWEEMRLLVIEMRGRGYQLYLFSGMRHVSAMFYDKDTAYPQKEADVGEECLAVARAAAAALGTEGREDGMV
jgi:hypothetical protein